MVLCPQADALSSANTDLPKANISNSETLGSVCKSLWITSNGPSVLRLHQSVCPESVWTIWTGDLLNPVWCCQSDGGHSIEPRASRGWREAWLNKTENTARDFKCKFLLNFNHSETEPLAVIQHWAPCCSAFLFHPYGGCAAAYSQGLWSIACVQIYSDITRQLAADKWQHW